MTQFKEEILKQIYKCIQRGVVDTEIIDFQILCIVIQNAEKFRDFKVFNGV